MRQAAEMLGITRQIVYRYVREGRLATVPDDLGRIVLDSASVKKFKSVPRKRGRPAKTS